MNKPAFTFLWHDYESTGLNPRRDRPTQFAAIRTDSDLNEIGEPINILCKPLPDMVPHIEACMVTGITPQYCAAHGLSEFDFAERINGELGLPGTVGTGFNTIKFDDEFTRHMLWRNLIDPYAREWKNGCGRWDIIDMVRAAYTLRPEGIVWPQREDGRQSFKLEDIARANGILHDAAHDALSDVRATIGVARLVRTANPRLFDFCFSLHKKDAVAAQIMQGRPFLHISGSNSSERGYVGILFPIAPNPLNKNEFYCWDLLDDPGALLSADAATAKATMFKRSADLAKGEVRLALRTIALNKSPMVFQDLRVLSPERAKELNVDLSAAQNNLVRLREVMAQRDVPQLLREIFAREQTLQDPEDDLYGAFVSDSDRSKLTVVRQFFFKDPADLARRLHDGAIVFADSRLTELVFRFRARHAPETLFCGERAAWAKFVEAKLIAGTDNHHTIANFVSSIETEAGKGAQDHAELLGHLRSYADTISATVDGLLAPASSPADAEHDDDPLAEQLPLPIGE